MIEEVFPHTYIFPDILPNVISLIPEDQQVYFVGGVVRDALLRKPAHDIDLCMISSPKGFARKVANELNGAFYMLDDERGTARVLFNAPSGEAYSIDFSVFRGPDLYTDLAARDFTINAMAMEIHHPQQLIDPLGGAVDLREKLLRACSETSFQEDPLRVLRGIRLAVSLGLRIVPETWEAMKASVPELELISAERKRDEIFRILEGKNPALSIRMVDRLGALPYIFPELESLKRVNQSAPHVYDVWEHTLAVLKQVDLLLDVLVYHENPETRTNHFMGQTALYLDRFREPLTGHLDERINPNRSIKALLLMAALYHDIAKPDTREMDADGRIRNFGHEKVGGEVVFNRARALQLSNPECDRLRDLVRYHMRIHSLASTEKPPSLRSLYRFFRDSGAGGVDIAILTLADVLGTYATSLPADTWTKYLEVVQELFSAYWNKTEKVVNPPSLIDGNELQNELHVAPGPLLGLLIEAIREEQAVGTVQNREDALQFARNWLSSDKRG